MVNTREKALGHGTIGNLQGYGRTVERGLSGGSTVSKTRARLRDKA